MCIRDRIEDDEIEIGIGIHGEPGRERMKWQPADILIENIVKNILEDLPFRASDEVAVMVNGLGATPTMELYIACLLYTSRCV